MKILREAEQSAPFGKCGDNVNWKLDDDGILTISGTGDMANYTLYDFAPWYSSRSSIKTVVIENGVTSIGSVAFCNCSSLTSVTISNSVTSIGNSTFSRCSRLTSITIPDSVTRIGYCAFYLCSSLESITIPNSVTSIGEEAFDDCTKLKTINASSKIKKIIQKQLSTKNDDAPVNYEDMDEMEYQEVLDDFWADAVEKLQKDHPELENFWGEPSIQGGGGGVWYRWTENGEDCTAITQYEDEIQLIEQLICEDDRDAAVARFAEWLYDKIQNNKETEE